MRLSPKAGLWLILVVSLGLRVWLAAEGGQGYWPDENMRYGESQTAAVRLLQSEWGGGAKELFGHADHLLFRWVALPAALLDEWLGASAFRAACYFSLFSTAVIGLIWGIVRRVGGGEGEALLAAGLAAGASSLFFYARHFFPYDAAIALMLVALWVGLGGRQAWRAGLAGVVVGAGFLTYNGYWLLGAVVLGLVVVEAGADWRRFAGRALLAGAGLLGSVGGMVLVSRCAGYDLLQGWRDNAATITQGDFGQGWRVILEYLWFAEGPLAVVWAAALAGGAWLAGRTRDAALGRWLGAVLLLAAGLIVLSDVVHKFVVYGRLVRPLVPFLCLLAARVVIVGRDRSGWPVWLRPGLFVIAAGCAAWNFSAPLGQMFPDDFLVRAREAAVQYQRQRPGVLQVLHAEHLWGVRLQSDLPSHEVILRAAHPLQFRPYQYEGFSVEQRKDFTRHDIAMKLICLSGLALAPGAADDTVSPPYYGPLKLRVRFPVHSAGRSEPLVSTGRTRKGDILFVRYEDETSVRFGLDHWSAGTVLSEPVRIEPGREYELLISLGSLLPEQAAGSPPPPWENPLRRLAFVALDGNPVLSVWQEFHPSAPEEAFIAGNFIGGSVARREFSGTITEIARASLRELGGLLPFARLAVDGRGAVWEGAAGPWRLRFRLPQDTGGVAEPLFSVRTGEGGEWLLFERVDDTRIRLRLERTDGIHWSEPFAVNPAESQEVLFSSGGLYPDAASRLFQQQPRWRLLKDLVFVSWNGRIVLLRNLAPLAGPAREAALGATLGGGVSARGYFSGLMEEMAPVGPDRILRESIHLVEMVGSRSGEWAGCPGPVRLRLRLPLTFPTNGVGEPLLVSGIPGAGDLLAVFYGADGRVRFSQDHWGIGNTPVSEPVRIEPGMECEILISAGFLWPPDEASFYQANPTLRELRRRVIVAVNGKTVLDAPAATHTATPESLTMGVNFIGGSTTAANFTGIIEGVEQAEVAEVLRLRAR